MNNLYQYYQPLELIAWQLQQQPEVTSSAESIVHHQVKLIVLGEASGSKEDQHGEPFMGRAGQLLTAMLNAIQLKHEDVFITNISKCRSSQNRDPNAEEMATSSPFLNQQIALLQPDLLLAVGDAAAHYLLNTKQSLDSLRGKIHHFGASQTPLIVTYHPADLLRNPMDKNKAYTDLQFAQKTLAASV